MTRQEMFDFIKSMYRENLKKGKDRKDCITILRYVLGEAYKKADYPFLKGKFPMKGEKITEDIKALIKARYVNQVNFYYPTDYKGKITFGVVEPYIFKSLGLRDLDNPGAKVISFMDGYHTGLLLNNHYFDNTTVKEGNGNILKMINDYIVYKWQYVSETNGTKFKTETIIAHLNLFDYLG